jgi:hypothetical protein
MGCPWSGRGFFGDFGRAGRRRYSTAVPGRLPLLLGHQLFPSTRARPAWSQGERAPHRPRPRVHRCCPLLRGRQLGVEQRRDKRACGFRWPFRRQSARSGPSGQHMLERSLRSSAHYTSLSHPFQCASCSSCWKRVVYHDKRHGTQPHAVPPRRARRGRTRSARCAGHASSGRSAGCRPGMVLDSSGERRGLRTRAPVRARTVPQQVMGACTLRAGARPRPPRPSAAACVPPQAPGPSRVPYWWHPTETSAGSSSSYMPAR